MTSPSDIDTNAKSAHKASNMPTAKENLRGVAYMILAMFVFAIVDYQARF